MKLVLPVPPSDNQIYWNNPRGGRVLRSAAKAYKRKVKKIIAELIAVADGGFYPRHTGEMPPDFVPNVPYEIFIRVYLKAVENKSWGTKRSPKARYKKADIGNRQKLVIDAVTEAIGIDDSHIMKEVLRKMESPDERTTVLIREMEATWA